MAHKKGQGSTRNGRDSKPKYLGIKKFDGERVSSGTILIRQKGSNVKCGLNVGEGKDYTLFALSEGIVQYTKKKKKFINVISSR